MSAISKTNAARLLDSQGIAYGLVSYRVDESDLSARAVAAALGQDIDRVFKTLVLRGDRTGVFVCVLPGSAALDLKKAAGVSGNKSAAMVPVREILGLTGYIRGGCSPVGMKRRYPTYIDESIVLYDQIFVSAGIRGLQFMIAPEDLVRASGAHVCSLT
ncbi:MAG: Cys-tRNA(Pro) deacylase [Spirochaetes bacterium]|nr:Cys-tRNA(Pro) deacylase [Spirochaetota bacterium]